MEVFRCVYVCVVVKGIVMLSKLDGDYVCVVANLMAFIEVQYKT